MERIRQAVVMAEGAEGAVDAARPIVAGVPLLARTILTLGRAGLTQIQIVAGGAAAALRAQLATDAAWARAGLTIEVVATVGPLRAPAGAVVVGLDHVFDPAAVRAVVDASGDAAGAVARAGRVGAEGEPVVLVGGEALFAALRQHGELAAASAALAAAGQLGEVELGDVLVERVDTPAGRARAQARLLRALTKPTDGVVARHLNRRVSRLVTRALLGTTVTPNQMTLVANAIGFLGVWLVAGATWAGVVAGAALVQVQSILDGCDGELARLKFQGSRLGEWLDNVLDDTINIAYGVALGHAAAVLLDEPLYGWLGLVTGGGYVIYNGVLYAHLALVHGSGNPFLFRWWFQKDDAYLQQSLAGAGLGARLVALVHAMGRRDLFLLAFLALCVVRLPHVAVIWYGAIALVSALLAIVHLLAGGVGNDLRMRRAASR